jgi:hypothetical protein
VSDDEAKLIERMTELATAFAIFMAEHPERLASSHEREDHEGT